MSANPARQEDLGSSFRTPLGPRTVSPAPPTGKQVRRKTSFVLRGDSSEDYPSPHDSIFEADYFSAANSEESSHRIELVSISQHKTPGATNENNENIQLITPANTFSVEDIEFRYGHGTVLETITEQKSSNTMRTLAGTRSADEIAKFSFLSHCHSFELAKSPRRKNSFSVDDLALIKRNYHEACAMIERETRKPLPVHEIYAQPKNPIHPPVNRPATPPGMPSWTASQNLPPRVRASNNEPVGQSRLQRFLNIPASGITHSSRVPAPSSISRGRTVSAPVVGRIAPRFRPPRSAYGPIDQHPFVNAPVAKVAETPSPAPPATPTSSATQTGTRLPKPTGKRKLGQRVRFTPSATARDSEMVSLQAAITSTSASAVHPLDPIQPTLHATLGPPRQPHCPHRKGRREALKIFNISLNHDSRSSPINEYSPVPVLSAPRQGSMLFLQNSHPLPLPTDLGSVASSRHNSLNAADSGVVDSVPSCSTSFSSTIHLMNGASRSSSPGLGSESCQASNRSHINNETPQREPWCWKCTVGKGFAKIDQWWAQSASCLCIICCGLDIDDDLSLSHGNGGSHSAHRNIAGRTFGRERLGPRRVILEQTPVVVL